MGGLDYVMTQSQNEAYMAEFTAEQLEYFYNFPMWVNVVWAVAVFGGVLGSLLLLFRSKLSFPVLAISFLAMVLTTIYNFGMTNGAELMGTAGAVFSGVIFVIALLLVVYARAMVKRGVLR